MNNPIYIGNGILGQIKNFGSTCKYTITKEYVFNYWMDSFKEWCEKYPDIEVHRNNPTLLYCL